MTTVSSSAVDVTGRLVRGLGGRFSSELDIDLDGGSDELEGGRWALAATLFGARISTAVAERTYSALLRLGLTHHRAMAACLGGPACRAVPQPEP